jgi:ferredoxin
MDENGYPDMDSLCGDALKLFNMDKEFTAMRQNRLADAYQEAQVSDKCIGCGRCVDVCWQQGIEMCDHRAQKTDKCIGCGYCFQVCPVGALHVEKEKILASAFEDRGITRGVKKDAE